MLLDVLRWLNTPISGSAEHVISPSVAWHGRLMVLAWLVLMPLVVILARFYKVTPGQDWPRVLDNPFWFISHLRLGVALAIITLAGLVSILVGHGIVGLQGLHHWLGWAVLALLTVQMVSSWLRGTHGGPVDPFTRLARPLPEWPGDHFSMTRRRIAFEYVHKYAGYLLIVLAPLALATGLHEADAPRWMWIASGLVAGMFVIFFLRFQRQGRCLDTYQAIWGPDPSLPGNRRRHPIGWGITRYDQDMR